MDTEAWLPEPEFHRDDFLSLQPPSFLREQAYDYLSRQVSHHPEILSYHVGRIQAAVTQGEEAVYASLIDLIWVLGNRGRSLQKRLIHAARKWLSQEKYDVLTSHISRRSPSLPLPFSCRCVVHDGSWGKVDWAIEGPSGEAESVDWVQAAQDCLGMGQIDQAREILEGLVAETPENSRARQALLEIFRATNETERFFQFYEMLKDKACLDSAWQTAFDQIKGEGALTSDE